LLLKEYGPTYVHVKGTDNIVANALSRLAADFEAEMPTANCPTEMAHAFSKEKDKQFPMSPKYIEKYLKLDKAKKRLTRTLIRQLRSIEGIDLICHHDKIYKGKLRKH
jgi:hypothetical protein